MRLTSSSDMGAPPVPIVRQGVRAERCVRPHRDARGEGGQPLPPLDVRCIQVKDASTSDGRPMAKPAVDLLQGTLDLLILKTLSWGPAHGYAVARWIQQATDDALAVGEGSLYPALHRLEEREWIAASWGPSENNRQAKYYALTRRGRAQLKIET